MSFGLALGFPRHRVGAVAWTPAMIPTALWLDAADASTITLNGSTVSQWNDKSGNGWNAVQATATNQPGWGVGRNFLLWSEEFQQAPWSVSAASIVTNQAIAPDGTLTADKLIDSVANSAHYIGQNFTSVSATTYTLSVYAKAAERNFVGVQFGGAGFSNQGIAVDLTTGQTQLYNSATGSATSVGNGWWRISVTATATGTIGAPLVSVNNSLTGQFYAGTGTSGVFIWGAQVNPGTTADQYQKTTSAAQTLSTGLNGKATMAWPDVLNNRFMETSASFATQDVFVVARYRDGTQSSFLGANQGVFGGAGAGSYIGLTGDSPDKWYTLCDFGQLRRNGGVAQALSTNVTALPLPPALLNANRPAGALTASFCVGNDRNLALNRGWSGIMGEIIVLSSIADTETRQRIEGYLAWKWGLEANLPANHPYKSLPPTA